MTKYFLTIPDNQVHFGFRFKEVYPDVQPFISEGLTGKPHLGDDIIVPIGTVGTATLRGRADQFEGPEGGLQILFYPENQNKVIRFMHLSEILKLGQIEPGDLLFKTGNSGSATTNPHLHCDISNLPFSLDINNFVDPATYDWSNMDKVFKRGDDPALYFIVGSVAVGYATTWEIFQKDFPGVEIETLTPTDFDARFKIAPDVVVSERQVKL